MKKAITLAMLVLLTIPLAIHLKQQLFPDQQLHLSAIATLGAIGIYWDQTCTKPVSSINWGTLSPGTQKDVYVYIKNQGTQTSYLTVKTENWNPTNAQQYLALSWTAQTSKIDPNATLRVKQTLRVSTLIRGITSFSFNILYNGTRPYPVWDINQDGVVDLKDYFSVQRAYGTNPESPDWNPTADVNSDRKIDLKDLVIVFTHYGEVYD